MGTEKGMNGLTFFNIGSGTLSQPNQKTINWGIFDCVDALFGVD
jgi:hypothetical protein